MVMYSKLVADRRKSDEAVAAAFAEHGPAAAEAVRAMLAPHARPGEATPDFGLLLTLFARHLEARGEAMQAADQAHLAEQRDDGPAFAARDEAARAYGRSVVTVRGLLTDQYGQDFGGRLAVSGPTPDDPNLLRAFGATFIRALRDFDPPPPDPEGLAVPFDKATTLAVLERQHAALEEALAAVQRERRELETTQAAKDAAVAEHDFVFGVAATVLEAFLDAAGMSRFARRVRPSRRRPGRTAESVSEADTSPVPTPIVAPETEA